MSGPETALAVLLRKGQWLLDEAAFEVGAGRYGVTERQELADALDQLAAALRDSTAASVPVVIGVDVATTERTDHA